MMSWPYDVLRKRIYQIDKYDEAYKAEMDKQQRDAKSKTPSNPKISAGKVKSFR